MVNRARAVNPKLRDLMARALEAAGLTQDELIRRTGFGRGPIGVVVRGEIQRLAPDVAAAIVRELPVSMPELLTAVGYDFGPKPQKIPGWLIADLERLSREDLEVVRRVVQGLLAAPRSQQ